MTKKLNQEECMNATIIGSNPIETQMIESINSTPELSGFKIFYANTVVETDRTVIRAINRINLKDDWFVDVYIRYRYNGKKTRQSDKFKYDLVVYVPHKIIDNVSTRHSGFSYMNITTNNHITIKNLIKDLNVAMQTYGQVLNTVEHMMKESSKKKRVVKGVDQNKEKSTEEINVNNEAVTPTDVEQQLDNMLGNSSRIAAE